MIFVSQTRAQHTHNSGSLSDMHSQTRAQQKQKKSAIVSFSPSQCLNLPYHSDMGIMKKFPNSHALLHCGWPFYHFNSPTEKGPGKE